MYILQAKSYKENDAIKIVIFSDTLQHLINPSSSAFIFENFSYLQLQIQLS